MTDPNRLPLWRPPLSEAIAEACANHPDGVVDLKPAAIQAMIFAVRDWLLPEELPLNPLDDTRPAQRGQRQYLRAILTSEAEKVLPAKRRRLANR
jgi:hypothetical protein